MANLELWRRWPKKPDEKKKVAATVSSEQVTVVVRETKSDSPYVAPGFGKGVRVRREGLIGRDPQKNGLSTYEP